MYSYVWLCRAMYGCVGLCTAVYGNVWLCRAMYGCVGLCTAGMAMHGYLGLCTAVYGNVYWSVVHLSWTAVILLNGWSHSCK